MPQSSNPRLDPESALAVIPLLRDESARIKVRNDLLHYLAGNMQHLSPPMQASILAEQLQAPEYENFRSRCLAAVRRLSRNRSAPTAHQIVRILRQERA